ncbi:pyridoxal-phosphate-dependent aminotransferase family protein [Biomaibacter acetigenes]|uniref:pyridoxal-phosphate-dependent aminotransferase family protein n=1 Tax=Biomaibacter acetigenes TaxID=2316383 RepID=UPI0013CF380F|nr:alanine--glyoxylate aminotransferase family protein [Biomaibacter acetigenes]
MEKILMIPGPCDVEQDVLLEMSRQVVCHYGTEWTNFYNQTCDLVKELLNVAGDVFIVNGSGHLALESMVLALGERNDEIGIVDNGNFSHRMIEILDTYGIKPKVLEIEWGKIVTPEQVDEFLTKNPTVKSLALVHSETSTGVLNPIEEIGRITKKRGIIFAVDAVSSAGIVPIDMESDGIDLCATASQKGIGAPPGLAIVAASEKGLDFIRKRKKPIPGWYASLSIWDKFRREQASFQPYSITMAVNLVFSLNKCLKAIKEEGIAQRYKRHNDIASMLRMGLKELGLNIFCKEAEATPAITVVEIPEEIGTINLINHLKNKYDILIANGLGKLKGRVVRIGHMGKNARLVNIMALLRGIEEFLVQ